MLDLKRLVTKVQKTLRKLIVENSTVRNPNYQLSKVE
jgi:hypothetical protein